MINEKADWQTIFGLEVHEVNFHRLVTESVFTAGPGAEDVAMTHFHFHSSTAFGKNVLNFAKGRKCNSNEATADVLFKRQK